MPNQSENRVALLPDRIIDGRSDTAMEGMAVIVDGNSISAVVARDDIPSGIEAVELAGTTLRQWRAADRCVSGAYLR